MGYLDLTVLMTDDTTAVRRIMGSAIMNAGYWPDVRVTSVEKKRIRAIPDVRIIIPVPSFPFALAIRYPIRQTTAPMKG